MWATGTSGGAVQTVWSSSLTRAVTEHFKRWVMFKCCVYFTLCCGCREGELEELFNSLFAGMNAAAAGSRPPDSFSSPFFSSAAGGSGNSAGSAASKTQASAAAKKKRKKRRWWADGPWLNDVMITKPRCLALPCCATWSPSPQTCVKYSGLHVECNCMYRCEFVHLWWTDGSAVVSGYISHGSKSVYAELGLSCVWKFFGWLIFYWSWLKWQLILWKLMTHFCRNCPAIHHTTHSLPSYVSVL